MLIQPTIEKLCVMRLRGMAEAFEQQQQDANIHSLSFEERLRTPDLAQVFWAAEENDLTRIYRSGWLLRAALKEKLGPCRSFSCRSFRRSEERRVGKERRS